MHNYGRRENNAKVGATLNKGCGKVSLGLRMVIKFDRSFWWEGFFGSVWSYWRVCSRETEIYRIAVHVGMTNILLSIWFGISERLLRGFDAAFALWNFFDPSTDTEISSFPCSWNRSRKLVHGGKGQGAIRFRTSYGWYLGETLLNITFQGAFSTMPPNSEDVNLRWQLFVRCAWYMEADLIEMARIRGFRKQIKDCPWNLSNRSNMKEFLFSRKMNPGHGIVCRKCMTNIQEGIIAWDEWTRFIVNMVVLLLGNITGNCL